ncbi:Hypothetical protein KNT65_gp006 [Escherichia phage EcS1]|uniref:Uncharacterized protein n=1 Tax=Escherichia phage EcS1 TaxID=2083276 RepID=A0A2Z5ZC77_9CAUD|nr:Hypothetical protein KNT65_gp006 [Escherichia phage EcS1]BBC78054.1 Hypothetical protein [Escherichia phage EcS1]
MKIEFLYGIHRYRECVSFLTKIQIGTRVLTKYSPVRLTNKQVRRLKKEAKAWVVIPFHELGKHHDENCKICKRA